jgi:DNA-binding XRE family transcriptional regulator
LLPIQCKMARVALELGVHDLAKLAGVSPDTVTRFEQGSDLKAKTVDGIKVALEKAGIEFVPEDGGGAGVRLRKPRGSRKD